MATLTSHDELNAAGDEIVDISMTKMTKKKKLEN